MIHYQSAPSICSSDCFCTKRYSDQMAMMLWG